MGLFHRSALACALLVVLVGCCDEAGRRRAGAIGTDDTPADLGKLVADATVPGMTLEHASIEGMSLEAKVVALTCRNGSGVSSQVRVNWHSELPALTFIQITVGSRTQVAKIWVEGGASGSETTGPWIENGAELTLLNASGKVLGIVRAAATECKSDLAAAS
ncbi:hypothetical protein [Stenotrophomonas maltophilia]|uniref:hypothetical protein n=1 Tax=Stenotrophomonas maltophilia TaxID=40324 RepID=UPI0016607842|nr:hypothetical protein [Stenotrophomonas maltophilia]